MKWKENWGNIRKIWKIIEKNRDKLKKIRENREKTENSK